MNERVKELRKALNLTMEKFGERLGVKKTAISLIESGRNNLTDQMFLSICREFNVNEEWLRNGTGEMFKEMSGDERIVEFINGIWTAPNDTFKKKIVSILAKMNEDEWKLFEAFAKRIISEDGGIT